MISGRASEIFLEASTLDPETRAKFVASRCGDDPQLLAEVNRLLTAANESEAYFDGLSGRVGLGALLEGDAPLPADKRIGQWRLLERIGRGGMGAVYLAERADEQFEQRAALKILPTGMDSDKARTRFLIERQILARLVHDNIARLLDGGVTEDGVPYFVMDYVDGLPIDDYCDRNALDIELRLRLVLDVARAVQFAHRNLVIHRDLKPSNVLVTSEGRVRLLDFGVAKILEPNADGAELTRVAQRPVTPAYASPEMLRGEAVDVTTDVYSIGVLAYVLLTGRLPLSYDGMGLTAMCEHALNAEPPLMSGIDPAVSADLDAIVARALAKTPGERYESVEGLANDIRNYLDGMPVTAKAPSAVYRARKFLGRHRVGASFTAFAVVALATITGLAVRSAAVADRQARAIALERDRAEQTREFLIGIFDSADPNIAPGDQTALQILDAGRARIEQALAGQPAVQADLLRAMSEVYNGMRLTDEALDVLMAEQQLRAGIDGENSAAYADVLIRLAQNTDIAGDYEASLEYARRALSTAEAVDDRVMQAAAHTRVGRVRHLQGDYDGADAGYRNALALYLADHGEDSLQVAQTRSHLGNLLNHQGHHEQALAEFEEALRIRRMHIAGDHSDLTEIMLGMASTLHSLDRLDDATELYEEAFAMNERLYGPDNSFNLYIVNGLGKIAESRGEYDTAIGLYHDAIRLLRLHTPDSPNLGIAHANLGKAHMLSERYDLAVPAYRDAVAVLEERLPDHWITGSVKSRLARCLTELGEYEEAEPLILEGIDALEKQWGPDDPRTLDAHSVASELYAAWEQPGNPARTTAN